MGGGGVSDGGAAAREEERQRQIDKNIEQVRVMYGVDPHGVTGDFTEAAPPEFISKTVTNNVPNGRQPGNQTSTVTQRVRNPEYDAWLKRRDEHGSKREAGGKAAENKKKLDAWLDDYGRTVEEANRVEFDDAFTTTAMQNRWALADRGLMGGSADAGVQRQQIAELVAGRQKVIQAGRDAKKQAQATLTQQRFNLENQAAAGTNLNMDFKGLTDQVDLNLGIAKSQIVPTAIGNSLSRIGTVAGEYQAAQGGRNNGGGNSAGSASGTITKN